MEERSNSLLPLDSHTIWRWVSDNEQAFVFGLKKYSDWLEQHFTRVDLDDKMVGLSK